MEQKKNIRKHVYPDGSIYEGEWLNGKHHGKGKFTCPNGPPEIEFKNGYMYGAVYEGEWLDGKENGRGKHTAPDGSSYEGEWQNGYPCGKGKYTNHSGYTVEGYGKNGILYEGTITYPFSTTKNIVINSTK